MRFASANGAIMGADRNCLSRRALLRLGAAGLFLPEAFQAAVAAPDRTEWLANELREAAKRGASFKLPAGIIATRSLELPDGATIVGAPSGSTLRLIGQGPLFHASAARSIEIESVTFDGGGNAFADPKRGLLDFSDVPGLKIHGCAIRNSGGRGVNLTRCGGRFAQNMIERVRDAGYFSLDGLGVDIDGNHLRECGDNGVLVWTSVAGRYEGSRVRNNVIEDVHNFSGGDGAYGNGVGVFNCGFVRVENNKISRCAYTAVRNNNGNDVSVTGNECKTFGEKAMYAEFGAKRAAFRDNKIDDAGAGIAVTNAERGTDVGWVTGNTITGLRETHPDDEFGPNMFWLTGILGEKNCEIAGNTVVGSPWIGIALGGYRENLSAESNTLVDNAYGITFATGLRVGNAVIAGNKIVGSKKAAIAAMSGPNVLPGDASAPGEAAKYPRLSVRDNILG
jgi:uncharacterized secreted repeat protein (TIGR03808 family)